ncbi:MAG: hypothetical protein ACUVTP_08440 [Candidatus Fervidibacter sp.]|uniref:hypothetical protein n=1 Tax=Candidatus Fervidibacter sp. TaxID=3100871 RepID=UPI00404A91E7
MWKIVGYKGIPIPACPRDIIKVAVHKDQPNLAFLYFWSHKGIKGRVMERTSNGQVIALSEAQAYLYKGDQQLSGPWESGSDGYFFVPPFVIDTILNQHGGGTYTVKVIPPARSMMRPVPQERTKNVDLTKCERLNPLDTCTRALTIDVGLFYFSYEPAFPGPGDGD